jgi:hypothetical protein
MVHATAGAIIGQNAHNRIFAFAIGFIIHFFIDLIPHGDSDIYDRYKKGELKKRAISMVMIDGILTILWILFLTDVVPTDKKNAMTAGIAGSVLPDLIVGLSETFKKIKSFRNFQKLHINIHNCVIKKIKKDWPWLMGASFQLLILAILINYIKC